MPRAIPKAVVAPIGRRSRGGMGSTGWLAAGVGLFFLAGAGCAALPQFGHPEPAGPPYDPDAPVPAEVEDNAVVVPPPESWRHDPDAPPARTPIRRRPSASRSDSVRADSLTIDHLVPGVVDDSLGLSLEAEEAAIDSTEKPRTPVVISLPPEEMVELEQRAQIDLEVAEALFQTIHEERLGRPEKEKLRTLSGLFSEVRNALDRRDIQAAANLARKARLIAHELTSD